MRRSSRPSARGRESAQASGRRLISSGAAFELIAGDTRAVVDGDDILVSGTTGHGDATMSLPDDLVAPTYQCCASIANALAHAGANLDEVVRVR